MNIKLIVMDMDGTLLKSDNTISKRTLNTLLRAQRNGIRLVLASGRSYTKLMDYAKQLHMDEYGGYLIEVNGIARYDLANGKRTVYHQLRKEESMQIFHALKDFTVEILGMGDDTIYDYIPQSMIADKIRYRKEHNMPDDHPWTAGAFAFIHDNRKGYPNQYRIEDAQELPDALNKFAAAHFEHVLTPQIPAIRSALEQDFWLGLTSPGWLEIMPKNVTKGSALRELAMELQIEMDQIMAFGDGENDIEMLQAVSYGVVMGNAMEQVKEHGWLVCSDNNHDGIAETIDTYL